MIVADAVCGVHCVYACCCMRVELCVRVGVYVEWFVDVSVWLIGLLVGVMVC